jgi:hypothetical protein
MFRGTVAILLVFSSILPIVWLLLRSAPAPRQPGPSKRLQRTHTDSAAIIDQLLSDGGYDAEHPDRDSLYQLEPFSWRSLRSDWRAEWALLNVWHEDFAAELLFAEQEAEASYAAARELRLDVDRVWGIVYGNLARQSEARLHNVNASFETFRDRLGLGRLELATLVLNFVQSIPYAIPPNKLGLLPPARSMAVHSGDCDTKSLLAVLLLRRLGYDAVMLHSRHYKHAMVGLAVRSDGYYLEHRGRRYYFSETTATGVRIGQISAETRDRRYWRVMPMNLSFGGSPS